MKAVKAVLTRWRNSVYSCVLRMTKEFISFLAEWFGLIALLFGLFCVVLGVFLVWGLGIGLVVFGSFTAILGVLYNMGARN